MRKIHVGGYAGGTTIINLNEDGSGTIRVRYRKMTDPTVTKEWVEKDFSTIRGGSEEINARVVSLADGTEQMTGYPDIVDEVLYLQ